jgi:CRISPR-associated protein Csa3
LRPDTESDTERAEQAVADVEQLLQEIEPEAECAIKRITTDSLPETIQDCCGVIAGTADEAAVIVSLGGGARDILLPLTVASLVLTDCIDQALFFSDLDSTVEEWSLPHLRARVPDRTTETFETIAAAGDWLRLSTITDRTTHSKSTVIRHVNDLEDEGVLEADTSQKVKQVRLSFSGELVALTRRGGIA